ncbi:MAG: type II toxin-antitoxin system RelE/ParE family toxin [gamma proteobacterium endosymbiont of Lamellibrachia anaximandri]|nr:type II toxin-antitoxin system RelE/ParE family toxin [gamma proteobacterium endosymbiont of Lamellibrachia anaximandri]
MADYELSNKADEDLTEIYAFSYQRFGEIKADAYLLALDECFCMLAEQPLLGKKIDHIRSGYLRHERTSHSIFYIQKRDGILIQRVLHQSMDSERHL